MLTGTGRRRCRLRSRVRNRRRFVQLALKGRRLRRRESLRWHYHRHCGTNWCRRGRVRCCNRCRWVVIGHRKMNTDCRWQIIGGGGWFWCLSITTPSRSWWFRYRQRDGFWGPRLSTASRSRWFRYRRYDRFGCIGIYTVNRSVWFWRCELGGFGRLGMPIVRGRCRLRSRQCGGIRSMWHMRQGWWF